MTCGGYDVASFIQVSNDRINRNVREHWFIENLNLNFWHQGVISLSGVSARV